MEMLFRCNILALVGGGSNPQYLPYKVMIWDDHQSRCIGELSFRSKVRAVKLRRDRIVVVLEHKIYVYNFVDLKLLHQIETMANPKGLCAVSHATNSFVLACPGLHRGQMRVEHYGLKRRGPSLLLPMILTSPALRSPSIAASLRLLVLRGLLYGSSTP